MNRILRQGAAALAFAAITGCSPVLDWREVRPAQAGVLALFPCKPQPREREVPLGGATVSMAMYSCSAGGATYSLSIVDLHDPARVGPAVLALRAAAAANVEGTEQVQGPAQVAGMTPQPAAQRVRITGRLPDGTDIEEQALYFVKGLQVFQAAVVGRRIEAQALDTFFSGVKLAS